MYPLGTCYFVNSKQWWGRNTKETMLEKDIKKEMEKES